MHQTGMGLGSTEHWLIILAIVVLLFQADRLTGALEDALKVIRKWME